MISILVNTGEKGDCGCAVCMNGDIDQIIADVTYAIRKIYKEISKNDEEAGEEFKNIMKRLVGDEYSPVWINENMISEKLIEILDEIKEKLGSISDDDIKETQDESKHIKD